MSEQHIIAKKAITSLLCATMIVPSSVITPVSAWATNTTAFTHSEDEDLDKPIKFKSKVFEQTLLKNISVTEEKTNVSSTKLETYRNGQYYITKRNALEWKEICIADTYGNKGTAEFEVDDDFLSDIKNFKNLKSLKLIVTKNVDLSVLTKLKKITEFELIDTRAGRKTYSFLSSFSNLEEISIERSNLENIPQEIINNPPKKIKLNFNSIANTEQVVELYKAYQEKYNRNPTSYDIEVQHQTLVFMSVADENNIAHFDLRRFLKAKPNSAEKELYEQRTRKTEETLGHETVDKYDHPYATINELKQREIYGYPDSSESKILNYAPYPNIRLFAPEHLSTIEMRMYGKRYNPQSLIETSDEYYWGQQKPIYSASCHLIALQQDVPINLRNNINTLTELLDKITLLNKQLEQEKSENIKKDKEVKQLEGELHTEKEKINKQLQDIIMLKNKNEQLQTDTIALNKKISELTDKVNELTRENGDLKQQISALLYKVKDLEKSVNTLTNTIKELKNKNQTLTGENSNYKKQIVQLEKDKSELQKQLEKLKQDLTRGEGNIADLKEQIEKLTRKISELTDKVNELTRENGDLKQQISQLQKKLSELEKQANTCKVSDAQKEKDLNKLKQELRDTKKQLEDTKKTLSDTSKSEKEKTEKVKELTRKISELTDKVNELTRANGDLKQQISQLQKKLSELEKQANTCKVSDAQKEKDLNKLKQELRDTKKQLEDTKKTLSDTSKSEKEKTEKVKELTRKISELEEKVKQCTDTHKKPKKDEGTQTSDELIKPNQKKDEDVIPSSELTPAFKHEAQTDISNTQTPSQSSQEDNVVSPSTSSTGTSNTKQSKEDRAIRLPQTGDILHTALATLAGTLGIGMIGGALYLKKKKH